MHANLLATNKLGPKWFSGFAHTHNILLLFLLKIVASVVVVVFAVVVVGCQWQ